MKLDISDVVNYEPQNVIDIAKIVYYNNRILRIISDKKQAELYKKILKEEYITELFELGLVKTKLVEDLVFNNAELILEHEKIDYFIDPSEMTNRMFWFAAKIFIKLNLKLSSQGLFLKDAHPWNITYYRGRPVFFDFSSIDSVEIVTNNWIDEFYSYFIVPLALANTKWSYLANEYRRQHLNGFGLKVSEMKFIKKYIFRQYFKLSKLQKEPVQFFQRLLDWIEDHEPKVVIGNWDNYNQAHDVEYLNPTTPKQKFVYNILKEARPTKVIDLATNKGFYAMMAESLGAKVIGFDYEEFSVDSAIKNSIGKNITYCQMNFLTPTPPSGWALVIPDSFSRFHSDIAMGLGLIHHICLVQHFPVRLFCETCARYASSGVIIEFVYPEDLHVKKLNVLSPADYNPTDIKKYFGKFYKSVEESDIITDGGIKRQFFYFYNIINKEANQYK